MLDPRERQVLLECLRPPDGYRLDRAVGTSYSLDLIALLTAPLAFTFFDWDDSEGRPSADPIALLESVRRHASRIHVFCQAGEIKLPPPTQRLVAYLERSVVPIPMTPTGGIFHPKVWLIRFVADGAPVRFRFICLTRNLTFDRSWDNVLSLDGELLDRQRGIRANRPLADFIASLPGLAAPIRELPETDRAQIAQMAEEVRRVRFDLPEDVDEIAFWPLGIEGYARSPFAHNRENGAVLAASPFLSAPFLESLTEGRDECKLVSRPDQLTAMPKEILERFNEIFVLNSAVEDPGSVDGSEDSALSGLHAKLFIQEDGWNASVFTGSANATTAALNRNVEFITELIGKKSRLGLEAFLGDRSKKEGMWKILEPWTGESRPPTEDEAARQALEKELATSRRAIASARLALHCVEVADGSHRYRLELHSEAPLPDIAFKNLRCWPTTLRIESAAALVGAPPVLASFGPLSFDALTGFLACELSGTKGGVSLRSEFVLSLPLEGAPADRLDRLLAAQLKDKDHLLRFLWLLLETEGRVADLAEELNLGGEPGSGGEWAASFPLFERLVRSAIDSKDRLTDMGRLLEDLTRTQEGRDLIPEGLLPLWAELKKFIDRRAHGSRAT